MSDEKTIFCGNGRIFEASFGIIPKMSFSKENLQTMLDYMNNNNLEWVNCEMIKKQKLEEKKPTHYIKIDTYKAKPNVQSRISNTPIKKSDIDSNDSECPDDDLPF